MNKILNHPNLSGEILAAIRSNLAPKALLEALSAYHETDIALTLPLLTREEQQKLMHILPTDELAQVLECAEGATSYLSLLRIRQKAAVVSRMESSAAADILQTLPKEERAALLDLLDADAQADIRLLRSFDDEEIGSRMTTNYIAISDEATIKEAMSELVRQAAENDNISTLYLVDRANRFCGAMDLKDLILAREGTPISDITTASYPYLYARSPIADCIPYLTQYKENAIPILDEENRLLGVVTAQDFAEILDDELSEDYAKLAGLSSEEDLAESIGQSVKKRLPWLCILLVLGLGVSATVGLFESIVAQLPVILCFQSLILDMAGNVGTQSLAVAIRVLMDNQLHRRDKARLIWKEVRVGLLNGSILGLLSFAVIGLYLYLVGNAPLFAFAVSGCLGVAMVLAMVISSLSGTVIPIFFQKLGIDPAVASGPLITTVNDLVAVVTYYGLAWLILLNLLHLG